MSKMVESDVPMSEADLVSWNTQLIFAGNETTSKLMGLSRRARSAPRAAGRAS
ncbi:hypothetical protein [Aeromicrobium sp. UC242_57]|uniref:hypothetical protein n=1 Tax=Aeromicrobium sp. UC242_57 TaxID=3374624 RepID=UPI0037BB1A93